MQTLTETSDSYKNFVNSLDSEYSRIGYIRSFRQFVKFCKVDTYEELLQIDLKRLEGIIRDYIIHMREDRKLSPSSVANYCAAISHFFEMNDVTINWKKLKKFKGRLRRVIEDVPYTRDQIKTLIDNATLRDRSVILLMSSAGLRRGAIPSLMLKDLKKIDKYDLYKITVYKKEQEQYITYCTPECAKVIDQYLDWRKRLGENLQPNTILIRREFDTTSHIIIAKPRPLSRETIGHNISILLDKTGIRPHTEFHAKSNIMTCHAFRKFFDTQCINHNMNPLYAEYLMGHKTGLIKSYFKPTDQELLEGNDKSQGYTSIIPYLTINATEEENTKLRERLAELKETHSKEWELVRQDKKQQAERDKQFRVEMNTKLYERNNDIADLKAAVAFLADKVNAAIIANEPSSKVIFNQKGIPSIKIPAANKNTVTAQFVKITEENQVSATTTCTQSNLKQSK